MGLVSFFNIAQVMQRFSTDTFFETGLGFGSSVDWVQRLPFKRIFSVEIVAEQVEAMRPKFAADPRVELIAGKSEDAMRERLAGLEGNVLFWLDAHYPGFGHGGRSLDAEPDLDVRLPLERELHLIKNLRPVCRDVILIDDLRIYEDDKFEHGSMMDLNLASLARFDSKFLYEIFADTHNARRFLNHTGYLALTPKTP
jgi:hypothetical protein